MTPLEGLLAPFQSPFDIKHNYTAVDQDNNIVCMFGVVLVNDAMERPEWNHGIIWLLGSDLMDTYYRDIIRVNKKWLNLIQVDHNYVSNYISIHQEKSIKWLRWLGFEFNSKSVLVKGVEMVYFYRSYNLEQKD